MCFIENETLSSTTYTQSHSAPVTHHLSAKHQLFLDKKDKVGKNKPYNAPIYTTENRI